MKGCRKVLYFLHLQSSALAWKIQEEGKRRLDRAAADDGVGGHALPFLLLLLLLQAAGEQRALFVSSLSLILSAPSQDRFDAKHFWSCQNPPDPAIFFFPQSLRWQSLLLHFCTGLFCIFCDNAFKVLSRTFLRGFSTTKELPFGSSQLDKKLRYLRTSALARPVLCTRLRFVINS